LIGTGLEKIDKKKLGREELKLVRRRSVVTNVKIFLRKEIAEHVEESILIKVG